jgi:hypothetical protein
MVEKMPPTSPSTAKDNQTQQIIKKNFVPQTTPHVQGNHVPTTNEKPSTPAPSPKKK